MDNIILLVYTKQIHNTSSASSKSFFHSLNISIYACLPSLPISSGDSRYSGMISHLPVKLLIQFRLPIVMHYLKYIFSNNHIPSPWQFTPDIQSPRQFTPDIQSPRQFIPYILIICVLSYNTTIICVYYKIVDCGVYCFVKLTSVD